MRKSESNDRVVLCFFFFFLFLCLRESEGERSYWLEWKSFSKWVMGGGAMWRSIIRVVGSGPTSAATNAAMCRMCTTTPSLKAPTSARITCDCPSEVHSPGSTTDSGFKQYLDIEDWEFAGDEDYLVFGTLPTQGEVEEATSDLQHALQIGLFTNRSSNPLESSLARAGSSGKEKDGAVSRDPKVDGEDAGYHVVDAVADDWLEPSVALASSSKGKEVAGSGGKSAMLEAFHQFQHNPQIQQMVVSLATDKGVWDAVLANDQIKEFRKKLREAPEMIENSSDSTIEEVSKCLKEDYNIFSHVYWNTKKAFAHFMATLQELIRGILVTAEEKFQPTETDDFFDRTVRATMMLSVLVMSLVVFKRSAARSS